ncbi:MAG: hypothetical protein ACXWPS_22085, partial [Ktedonobacteraceae bacterium]
MAAPGQYHYYGKITLTALVIGCVTGDLLFIIPTMIVIGSNGTTTNSPSLADSLLSSIAGLGVLILVVEMVFVMVRDWRGAMTLRFAANTKFWYRGKLVSAKYWFFVLHPHSAEWLTEKRISSKVRKKAEGAKRVSRSGVSNRASGSFGDSGRG